MVTIPRIILSSSWTATSRLHSELVFWDSCHKLRTVSFRRTPSWHHPAHRAMGSNHPAAIPSSSSYRDAGFSIKIMISASRGNGLVEKFHGICIKKRIPSTHLQLGYLWVRFGECISVSAECKTECGNSFKRPEPIFYCNYQVIISSGHSQGIIFFARHLLKACKT